MAAANSRNFNCLISNDIKAIRPFIMKSFLVTTQYSSKLLLSLVFCIALILEGCGGSAPNAPATLSNIAISPNPVFIGAGTTLGLTATGNYSDRTSANLTSQVMWTSAASGVASVGAGGLVTAVASSGASTTITAALNGVTSPAVPISVTTAGSSSTNGLITARYDHTATLLNDGTVLVAGGYGTAGNALASAELYYPVASGVIPAGTWTPTGSMVSARRDHTATFLPTTGQVVQIGGGNVTDLNSAEIYTPTGTGTWASYGILNTPRSYHTATLLTTGKILVVGGGGLTNYNELYDPTHPFNTSSITANDISPTGRYSHTATLLPDGRVLVVGGFANSATVPGAGSVLASVELCDAAGSTMTQADSLVTGRYLHSATLLGNGKVLVVGGIDSNGNIIASAELFDPSAVPGSQWTSAGNLFTPRFGHIATLMPSGQVLVMGGSNAGDPKSFQCRIVRPGRRNMELNCQSANWARCVYRHSIVIR